MPAAPRLADLRSFLLDLDGVLYTGDTPIPGAAAFVEYLSATGRTFQCITNNSTLTAAQFAAKLVGMGIPVHEEQVLTSPQAAAVLLREQAGEGVRLFMIGEIGLASALLEAGFRLAARAEPVPAAVVVGLDRRLTYERLRQACQAVRAGARFLATNPDLALPTERGFSPGNGATLAYIQAATGVAPLVVGKPAATMLQVAMRRLGAAPEQTAIIGDSLGTDILAGQRAGIATILVLTGVSSRADLTHAPVQPDFVFEDLVALKAAGG